MFELEEYKLELIKDDKSYSSVKAAVLKANDLVLV